MTNSFTIQLVGVVALVGCLCWSFWQRNREAWQRQREARERELAFRKQWQPARLEVSLIAPQIQELRHNHVKVDHHRSRHAGYRHQLLAAVRTTILRHSYFQNPNDGPTRPG